VAVESVRVGGKRGRARRASLAFDSLVVERGRGGVGVNRCHAGNCGEDGMTGKDGKMGEGLNGMRWRGLLGVMRWV
jgi:hypothetical protein